MGGSWWRTSTTPGRSATPSRPLFDRSNEIYEQTALRNGGDPFIGVRLPGLLLDAGFERVQPSIAHPVGLEGDVKLLPPLTIENIKAMAVKHAVATAEEVDDGRRSALRARPRPVGAGRNPHIVQVWGEKAVTRPQRWRHSSPLSGLQPLDSTVVALGG